jgi:hypothetical protein
MHHDACRSDTTNTRRIRAALRHATGRTRSHASRGASGHEIRADLTSWPRGGRPGPRSRPHRLRPGPRAAPASSRHRPQGRVYQSNRVGPPRDRVGQCKTEEHFRTMYDTAPALYSPKIICEKYKPPCGPSNASAGTLTRSNIPFHRKDSGASFSERASNRHKRDPRQRNEPKP